MMSLTPTYRYTTYLFCSRFVDTMGIEDRHASSRGIFPCRYL